MKNLLAHDKLLLKLVRYVCADDSLTQTKKDDLLTQIEDEMRTPSGRVWVDQLLESQSRIDPRQLTLFPAKPIRHVSN